MRISRIPTSGPIEVARFQRVEGDACRNCHQRSRDDAPDVFVSSHRDSWDHKRWAEHCHTYAASTVNAGWRAALPRGIWVARAEAVLRYENAFEVEIGGVWVDPAWRRRGLAQAVLDRAHHWADHHDADRIVLWVHASNEAAQSLYRGCGYTFTGTERAGQHGPEQLWQLQVS